jgi:plasmid maintenance system antidote protein VapI
MSERTPITRLAGHLRDKGWSGYHLARAMGWSPNAGYANQIVRGDILVSKSTAIKICEKVEASLQEMFVQPEHGKYRAQKDSFTPSAWK